MCPLEWGLGHATRCIPIIKELIAQGAEVLIGAEGATAALLRSEFPTLQFLPLMGYRVSYSRKKYFLPLHLIFQIPKIVLTIVSETRWLKKMIRTHNINAVISDNRFGLYNRSVHTVYITHQLLIKTNNKLTERQAQKIHYRYIKKYNECWIPDDREKGLAGVLSHPSHLPENAQYIGALSRFVKHDAEIKYDLLITISGPEPQRTMFENIILNDLRSYEGKVLFVRGLPGGGDTQPESAEHHSIVNHLSAIEMNKAMESSGLVISRSGYTTIMDLVKLGKKAVLVPTPGQTEQEYLADHLMSMGWFYCVDQKNFSLLRVLHQASSFPFNIPSVNMEQYKISVSKLMNKLNHIDT